MANQKNEEESKKKKKGFIFFWIIIAFIIAILSFEIIILVKFYSNGYSTIDIFGYKPYLVSENIDDLHVEKGSILVGKKDVDSNIQVFKTGKNKAKIVDTFKDNRYLKNYECDVSSSTRVWGELVEILKQFFWVVFVIFGLYNIIYFISDRSSFGNIAVLITKVGILLILICSYIIIKNIGYVNDYSSKMTVDIIDNNGDNDNNDDVEYEFYISDKNQRWSQGTILNVFDNKFYNTNKIAPGVYGSYKFSVINKSDIDFIYKISFSEENDSKVNLKYRLVKNQEYLTPDYEDVKDIENIELNASEVDNYVLEWKWVDSDNDTEIGLNAENVVYILHIDVVAEQNI